MIFIYRILTFPILIIYRLLLITFGLKWNTKVIDNQYISGGYIFQKDYDFLYKNNIKIIINLATELSFSKEKLKNIEYYQYNIKDGGIPKKEEVIEIFNIIDKAISKNISVNVNCALGSGRSSFIIIYYLTKSGKFNNYKDAFNFLKKKRLQIGLNKNQRFFLKEILKNK